jgi:hypothetical protein
LKLALLLRTTLSGARPHIIELMDDGITLKMKCKIFGRNHSWSNRGISQYSSLEILSKKGKIVPVLN